MRMRNPMTIAVPILSHQRRANERRGSVHDSFSQTFHPPFIIPRSVQEYLKWELQSSGSVDATSQGLGLCSSSDSISHTV